MQQKECIIIKDLLPSHIEQLLNDTSVSVVEEHLQRCKSCKKIYQELLFQEEEQRIIFKQER